MKNQKLIELLIRIEIGIRKNEDHFKDQREQLEELLKDGFQFATKDARDAILKEVIYIKGLLREYIVKTNHTPATDLFIKILRLEQQLNQT